MSSKKDRQFSLDGISYSDYAGADFSGLSKEDLAKLWRKTLNNGMHGICFSMYEDGQEPGDTITE